MAIYKQITLRESGKRLIVNTDRVTAVLEGEDGRAVVIMDAQAYPITATYEQACQALGVNAS